MAKTKRLKGGWGGWATHPIVGGAWSPPANNSPSQLFAHENDNHFKLSPNGVLVGGIQPAVPEMNGPGINQRTPMVPHLPIGSLGSGQGNKIGGKRRRQSLKRISHKSSHKSSHKRSHKSSHKRSRSRRGGFVFGGFPQNMQFGWDNLKIGAQNTYRGFMGTNQLDSASPWVQPELNAKMGPVPPKFVDPSDLVKTASMKVAKIL